MYAYRSICTLLTMAAWCAVAGRTQPGPMLFDFEPGFTLASAKAFGSSLALASGEEGTGLAIRPQGAAAWEGVAFSFPAKDLSAHLGLIVRVRNTGNRALTVFAEADDDNAYPSCKGALTVEPGGADTLYVHFHRRSPPAHLAAHFQGMRGLPGGYTEHWEYIEPAKITRVQVSVFKAGSDQSLVIDDLRAWGDFAPPREAELRAGYFPLLDTLGQFRHGVWPGKAGGAGDLAEQAAAETLELSLQPGPADWNAYGGWKSGPNLEATGRFRTQKFEGKWWLVDPEGRLFWSQGITCVNSGETTPSSGRENYFTAIPSNGNFRGANMRRKFGADWTAEASELAHRRMRSWGLNTIGNWSDRSVYSLRKTPYTVNFGTGQPQTLPSALDTAAFRASVKTALARLKTEIAGDPFCLGVFSDNELAWPATAAAVAEDYYRIVSQEMKSALPGVLYLGSRIHNAPEAVWRAAGRYCDVISHNRYEYVLDGIPLPAGADVPVMLTEFHFGALDRGLPHTGLRAVFNQAQRARAYSALVAECLAHPNLVGAHWFQYSDQVYTGRADGENYQIGFVDVCDRPYPEMTAAARSLSSNLYVTRMPGAGSSIPRPRAMRGGPGGRTGIPADALGRRPGSLPSPAFRLPPAPP